VLCIIDQCVTERSDRLQRAFRESSFAANGLSALATARSLGWNPNSFKSNLNGNSPFSFDQAKKYADKFRVRAEWLYDGNGPMREVHRPARLPIEVPLVGWVSAGEVSDVGQLEEVGRVVAGNLPPGEYFATEIVGDSMDRVAPEGAYIIVNAADRNPRDGNIYIFSHRGEPTVKRYRSKPVRRLEPFSTNPVHDPIFIGDKGWTCVGRVVRSVIDLA
jgi:SOS-response transcriptional repressor LexA